MPRYKFTGHGDEVFTDLAADITPVLGDAVLRPGEIIDVPGMVYHPRLELTDEAATVRDELDDVTEAEPETEEV